MKRVKISVWGFQCERCGHIWKPRKDEGKIRICPKCKSPYWDTPSKKKLKEMESKRSLKTAKTRKRR